MSNHDRASLERQFHAAMINIYREARSQTGYNATRFLQMVNERGGYQAAVDLLQSTEPSDGFTELFMRGNRLDLSVEYLVLQVPWRSLFDDEWLATAHKRLVDRNYPPPPDDQIERQV